MGVDRGCGSTFGICPGAAPHVPMTIHVTTACGPSRTPPRNMSIGMTNAIAPQAGKGGERHLDLRNAATDMRSTAEIMQMPRIDPLTRSASR